MISEHSSYEGRRMRLQSDLCRRIACTSILCCASPCVRSGCVSGTFRLRGHGGVVHVSQFNGVHARIGKFHEKQNNGSRFANGIGVYGSIHRA